MRAVILTCIAVGLVTSVVASSASYWKKVELDRSGLVTAVSVYQRPAESPKELSKDDNEYTVEEWNSFGITNALPYIIKQGNVWRNMTPAEQATVNSNIQVSVTTATTGDAQMDAILRTIAKAIDNNEKTYAGVVAIFKNEVDPKKVKEKSK
jgi:uncharacterized protein YxeA